MSDQKDTLKKFLKEKSGPTPQTPKNEWAQIYSKIEERESSSFASWLRARISVRAWATSAAMLLVAGFTLQQRYTHNTDSQPVPVVITASNERPPVSAAVMSAVEDPDTAVTDEQIDGMLDESGQYLLQAENGRIVGEDYLALADE